MRRFLMGALAAFTCCVLPHFTHTKLVAERGDLTFTFGGIFRPETFWAKNIGRLNDANCGFDKFWFARHILDLNLGATCGPFEAGHPKGEFFLSMRNKSVWGDPGSVASTNENTVKLGDFVFGEHKHTFPRHIIWMREGWIQFDLGRTFGLDFNNHHFFQIGAFRFELGRGIALGSAYAVGQQLLGFYNDGLVDQYAFGAKFSGDLIKNKLFYDLYGSVWDNKTGNKEDVLAKVYAQEYGRIATPSRGFGKVNFTIAGRLQFYPAKEKGVRTVCVEPYALFNGEAEQKVEFRGDASSRLGTLGLATEFDDVCYGVGGFDVAFNLGQQSVKGWDRNAVEVCVGAADGIVSLCNSHVVNADPTVATNSPAKVKYTTSGTTNPLIRSTLQSESENGKKIGNDGNQDLYNATDRFRDPYTNTYKGWMAVADYATPFWAGFRLATTAGYASGDDNPNEVTKDGDYKGFIGLQEAYIGKYVQSSFLLGSAGKTPRPLSLRNPRREKKRLVKSVSRFTNIGFVGGSALWAPEREDGLLIQSNILWYWQPKESKKFDVATGTFTEDRASSHLGTELNLLFNYKPMACMRMYFNAALFLPGQHYSDIKGVPLTKDEQKFIDLLDRTGFEGDRVPLLGDDRAYSFNFGINYAF